MGKKPVIKHWLVITFFTIFHSAVSAQDIQIVSPGNHQDIQPAIQAAVDNAGNGARIILPEGEFVFNKSVVINKFISFKGQGLKKTILYRDESVPDATLSNNSQWDGMFRFTINQNISSNISVSGICFKSKKPSLVDGDGLSRSKDVGIIMTYCLDFIITGCRFEFFGYAGILVTHDDNLAGSVIYKNEFFHNAKGYDALGLGYGVVVYGRNREWIADPKFGSSNFIFVEDNLFDYHRHSIAAGGSALYVFRYNTVLNNVAGNTNHAIDAHEARLSGLGNGNHFSTRAIEVYNNRIINTLFKDGTANVPNGTPIVPGKSVSWLTEAAIVTRGGESVIHHNYIEGYRFGVAIVTGLYTDLGTPGVYPYPYQQGYSSGLKHGVSHSGVDGDKSDGDVFSWGDNFHFYAPGNPANVPFYNYAPQEHFIKAGRDCHLFAKAGYTTYTYPHPLRKEPVITGIGDVSNALSRFSIYPNPLKGVFYISNFTLADGPKISIEFYNIAGMKLFSDTVRNEKNIRIDLGEQLVPGIYVVMITTKQGKFAGELVVQ